MEDNVIITLKELLKGRNDEFDKAIVKNFKTCAGYETFINEEYEE